MNNNARWNIYRFELVFFNSKENRWQLFQELLNTHENIGINQEGIYRQHIYAMLSTLREVFIDKINSSDKAVFKCSESLQKREESDEKNREIIIPIHIIDLINGLRLSGVDDTTLNNIVEEIKKSLEAEGININKRPGIQKLLEAIATESRRALKLSLHDALDLLSCLQIRRSWDIWGRLDQLSEVQESHASWAGAHDSTHLNDASAHSLSNRLASVPYFIYKLSTEKLGENNNTRIFICYRKEDDSAFVKKLSQDLAKSFEVLMDIGILVGDQWLKQLEEYCHTADAALILVNKKGLTPWQEEEKDICVRMSKKPGCIMQILPVLMSETSETLIEGFLGNRQHIKLDDLSYDEFLKKIKEAIHNHRIQVNSQKLSRSVCERLLGYNVDLDIAIYQKIQDDKKGFFTCIDKPYPYYKFCRDIEDITGKEAQWYTVYGHLIDMIQFGIAEEVNEHEKTSSSHNKTCKETFIIIYNIRACGWDHYLQIYVKKHIASTPDINTISKVDVKNNELEKLGLKELGDDLVKLGGIFLPESRFPMNVFKESAREYLIQIRISAFQYYVSNDIKDIPKNVTPNDLKKWIGDVFCRHAHNLVQLVWIRCEDDYFGYPLPGSNQTPDWQVIKEKDKQKLIESSKEDDKDHCRIISHSNPLIKAWIPWEDKYSALDNGALKPLLWGTSTQRLIDQYQWLCDKIVP